MYRKRSAIALLATALIVSAPRSDAANDGIIDITGRIVATTCQVDGKPPGGGAVKAVALGSISAGALAKLGDTAGDRGFVIRIGGNDECANDITAKIRFDPASPALDRTTGRLNVDAGDTAATNVQIQMTNQDGTPINMYTEDSQGVKVTDHVAEIGLIARYYSMGGVTSGTAASRVGFQVVYN
jgi:major type 1 subunit fimbrin (pilin)